jgi:hypothetical protein
MLADRDSLDLKRRWDVRGMLNNIRESKQDRDYKE